MAIGGFFERGGVTLTSFTRLFDAIATEATPFAADAAGDLVVVVVALRGEEVDGGEAQQIEEPPPTIP